MAARSLRPHDRGWRLHRGSFPELPLKPRHTLLSPCRLGPKRLRLRVHLLDLRLKPLGANAALLPLRPEDDGEHREEQGGDDEQPRTARPWRREPAPRDRTGD